MEEINFIIHGNDESLTGNPGGYTRMLKGSQKPSAIKYRLWCIHVRKEYNKQIHRETRNKTWEEISREKPLTTTKEKPARMDIEIDFADDKRSDCDNVYKGIADALFENDKYIMVGSFIGKQSPNKVGEVRVKIKIKI